MPKKKFITSMSDFTKTAGLIIPIFIALLTMSWNTYGEPRVRAIAKKEVKHIADKADSLTLSVDENKRHVKEINFSLKQVLLIMEKTNDPEIIAEVKRETNRFKPVHD